MPVYQEGGVEERMYCVDDRTGVITVMAPAQRRGYQGPVIVVEGLDFGGDGAGSLPFDQRPSPQPSSFDRIAEMEARVMF